MLFDLIGSIVGGNQQKKAASGAAAAQERVADKNIALAKDIYGQNKANLSPFMGQGQAYNPQINAFLATNPFNPDMANYQQSPDYAFRLKQGLDAVQARMPTSRLSGSAIKGMTEYGQNFAMQDMDNWRNNQRSAALDHYNAMAGQQGLGFNAASALAGVGNTYTGQVMGQNQNAADARSNALLAKGNINAGMINNGINSIYSAAGMMMGMPGMGGSSYGGF